MLSNNKFGTRSGWKFKKMWAAVGSVQQQQQLRRSCRVQGKTKQESLASSPSSFSSSSDTDDKHRHVPGSSSFVTADPSASSLSSYCHLEPVHITFHHSPFASEHTERVSLRGFLHLAVLLSAVNTLRAILENFRKYGILLSMPGTQILKTDFIYFTYAMLLLMGNLLLGYGIEAAACRNWLSNWYILYACLLNCTIIIVLPVYIVWNHMSHMMMGVSLLFMTIILAMKLISYHLVNADFRMAKMEQPSHKIAKAFYVGMAYPANITIGNLFYFWCAPTLCYQPVYPRNASFSLKYFIKRILELIVSVSMMYFVLEQYAHPTVKNSMIHFDQLDFIALVERVLKLSVSSLYIWLLIFYAYFHAYLNAVAELLRFGDRKFYEPWWNAKTLEEYWRLWNLPVHKWMKRHVYVPLRMRGFSSYRSILTVFLISGILHELIIGVSAHALQFWCFWGFLLQIPLIALTRLIHFYWPDSSFGNYFFWCSFCIVGQPMCVLLYYRAWSTNTYFLFF